MNNPYPVHELNGWRWFVCFFWGERTYAKNSLMLYWYVLPVVYYIMLGICVLGFNYFPWTLINLIATAGVVGAIVKDSLVYANRQMGMQLVNILVGIVCLHHEINIGMTIIYWPIEPFVFSIIALGGVLGLLRRLQNAVIWFLLERATKDMEVITHG
jgi:hypothetical protein